MRLLSFSSFVLRGFQCPDSIDERYFFLSAEIIFLQRIPKQRNHIFLVCASSYMTVVSLFVYLLVIQDKLLFQFS